MKYAISLLFYALIALSTSTAEANIPAYPYTDHNGDVRHVKIVRTQDKSGTTTEFIKSKPNEVEARDMNLNQSLEYGGIVNQSDLQWEQVEEYLPKSTRQ